MSVINLFYLILTLSMLSAFSVHSTESIKNEVVKQPNIVLIIVDDLGRQDLASYGSDFYETPNLDQLAAEGLKFNNTYCCSPTLRAVKNRFYEWSVAC